MPCSEGRSLASLIRAKGVHRLGDFIADDVGSEQLLLLAEPAQGAAAPVCLRGKSVLLALPRQLSAVAAMIMLDGMASRIILWPHDERIADLDAVMASCGADEAITIWPLKDHDEGRGAASRGGAISEEVCEPAVPTEWVLLTSGSTGVPKLVVHSLQSLAGHLIGRPAPCGTQPVWCTFYDVRRYGGLQILLRTLLGGGSLILSSPGESPSAFLTRAASGGSTHFLGTPSHWRRALMTPAHSLLSPVYVRLSGEVANQAILDRLKLAYPQAALVHAFASTEAGLGFEVSDGLAGFPAAFLTAANAGVELRVGGGTLHLRSTRVAKKTLDRDASQIAGDDGFVDTGDEVVLQGDRYFFIGRRDGVINVGGQKVHPEEVESVINQHPCVEMSRVAARPNPITGAIVMAEIVSRAGDPDLLLRCNGRSLEEEVKAFCRQHLAAYKIPASVRLVPNLPIAPSGKLVRPHA